MADVAKTYIGKKYGKTYQPEIEEGDKLRSEFANKYNISPEEMNAGDFKAKTTIDYLKPKGQVSTDEPPVIIAPDVNPLMNKPVYESLLGRGPSSVSAPEVAQDTEPGRISDIQAQESTKLTPRQEKEVSNVQGDMLVGASHALLGLLSGNYNRAAMEYGKGNEYLAGQRKQDLASMSKLVKTVGPNGEPIYTPTLEAADMQAYEAPKKGGAEKGYAPQKIKSKKTGDIQSASWNGKQFVQYDIDGNVKKVFDPEEWAGYIPSKMQSANTMSGGKDLYEVDPYTGKVTKKLSVAGRGDVMGGATKEEYDIITKGAAKGRDIIAKNSQDLAAAKEAADTIRSTNDPMTFSTTIGNLLRTAVGEKRLSDIEGARYMGDDYKGFMLRGEEYLRSKYGGQIPDTVRRNALNLSAYVQRKMEAQNEATIKSYQGAPSLSPKGKAAVRKLLGTEESQKVKPEKQAWGAKYGL